MHRSILAVFAMSTTAAVYAGHGAPEEVVVTSSRETHQIDVAQTVGISPDAAALIKKAPGASVNGNGPLTGIPQYRGMYGPRVHVSVNGNSISSGGPNWMDPPLSYAPAAQLESLEVYRGIAPVSAGQETIGGVINAKTWRGDFTTSDDIAINGRFRSGFQSVNEGWLASTTVVAANQSHRFKLAALTEEGNDAEFDGGDITPSNYERQRYDMGYGYHHNGHTLQLDVGLNETNDTGTPALPMDILYIDSELASLRYDYQGESWALDGKWYYSDIDHGMSNFHHRQSPMNNGMFRRNIATGKNQGFKLSVDLNDSQGLWRVGVDRRDEKHNSDIDNPNDGMFFVRNFNDAEREVWGAFVERQHHLGQQWSAELGLRFNRVSMDAGEVDGTPAIMMNSAAMLRDRFNNADRSQADDNLDWVIKLYNTVDDQRSFYVGLARKTRSASYQERYLWLPLESTGGLADGRTYTGNIDLDPEVAHEIETGFDYQGAKLRLSPRFFYRKVNDYIQGTETNSSAAVMFVAMMNMNNGSSNPAPLMFNNVDAVFYGFDMDWHYRLTQQWSMSGLINYVRGKRDDVSDDLYRIAPANMTLGLNYQRSQWGGSLEGHLFSKQHHVSQTNGEQKTAGYGLVNAKGYWQLSADARLGVGVDNLLDRRYHDHMAGYNRVMGNTSIAVGERLQGYGRNIYARVDYQW